MAREHELWLRSTIEEAMEPELPIIDPHHHLWERPDNAFLYNPYLLDELGQDTCCGHKVVQTVFVDCMSQYHDYGPVEMRPVGETVFIRDLATLNASGQYGAVRVAAGIVGFADLTLGSAVAQVLEAHIEAGNRRFRGIRYATGWDASDKIRNSHTNPPRGLLLDSKFREGFACLDKYGLSFDAWLYHPQMAELADLARAFPRTTIILDHIGGVLGIGPYTGKRNEVFEDWKSGISELAACENVVVKLGGLGIPLSGFGWHKRSKPPASLELAEDTGLFYLFCIEKFGIHRCMFESNFPVDKISYSYNILWNSFKHMTKNFSSEERTALFHDTAARVYRLETDNLA